MKDYCFPSVDLGLIRQKLKSGCPKCATGPAQIDNYKVNILTIKQFS